MQSKQKIPVHLHLYFVRNFKIVPNKLAQYSIHHYFFCKEYCVDNYTQITPTCTSHPLTAMMPM